MVLLVTRPQCDQSTNIYCFPTVFKKKAVPKRDDSDEKPPAPLVLQENVFIEVSRPKYLEDLHSEALEGLKLLQQEERIIGPEYQDNESTISTVSIRAEVDGGGFTTDSTIPDNSSQVSVRSSVSSRSSRSGLTRQGSTFRPLNSGKRSDKRTRRRHRRTIGGIPQHLQREFGLDRAEWTVGPQLEEEFVNGDSDVPQLAVHSPPETDNTENPLSSVQEELDDMALLQRLGSAQSGGQDRPWSLAVPGMTTAGSGQPGPPSPVMSMSPQAAYLSKIIPNAVLPPSIDVVEISRGSSRNSVRTVSKSSLMMSSPTSSRASSRASTARSTSSRSSTLTSASRQNHFHLSDSSCWSNSDSDTLVSDSSTISSSSTPHQRDPHDKKRQNKVNDSPKYPSNCKVIRGNESKKDGQFVRSLSVMKPKRAPPPPSRSYSLHNKMKRRSRDLAEVKITPSQTGEGNMKKIIDSPGYNADTSSLDEYPGSKTPSPVKPPQIVDSTQNNVPTDASNAKKEAPQVNIDRKVVSPSSGYSSQDAKNPSPKHKKGLLAKLHKLFPATTSAEVSTRAQPVVSKTSSAPVSTVSDKPSVKALRDLFTIPPHPRVHAPPPPPPEVWSQSPRSIELLLGPPASGNTYAVVKKNPKDKRPYRQPASTSTEGTVKAEEQQQTKGITVESKKVHISQEGPVNVVSRRNDSERLMQKNVDVKEHGKVQVSEILNSVLVRTVDGDTERLPAIVEEHKTSTQTTKNPSISSAAVVSLRHVGSPESSWPPPPPPVALGSPDEADYPLPPPPIFTETEIVHPVQVPPDKPAPATSDESTSLHSNEAPPLNIPPPPPYTAPPPPIKMYAISDKVELSPPQSKDVSPAPSKITLSPPKERASSPKGISHVVTLSSIPAQSTNASSPPAQKLSPIPSPPKPSPPPSQKMDIVPTKVIHAPSTKPSLLPSSSEVPPPPPPKAVIIVSSIVADLPTPPPSQVSTLIKKEVPIPAKEVTAEPAKAYTPPPEHIPVPPPIVSKPPSKVVSSPAKTSPSPPPPSTEVKVALIPPVVSNPVPEEVSTPPQTEVIQSQVEIPTPTVVSIPQPEDISQPSVEELSKPQEVSPPIEISVQSIKDSSPQPPVEVHSNTAPPAEEVSPPSDVLSPPLEVAPASSEEIPPSPKEVSSPEIVVVEASEPPAEPPAVVNERFLPIVVEVSYPELSEETSTDAVEEVLEDSQRPSKEIKISEEEIANEIDSTLPEWKNILTPPQSIPPPPPIEQPTSETLSSQEPDKPEEVPPQPEAPKPEEVPSQPETQKPEEVPSQPETQKPEEVPSQPEAQKPEEVPSQPEAQKPEEVPSQPEAPKPEEVPSQPEAQKPEEVPSQPEAEKPEEVPPQPEAQKPEEVPTKPEVQKPEEVPSQPEAQKPEEVPSQPEVQKPEEVPSQPEAQKPEEAPSQPEAQKPEEVPSQPEAEKPEEAPSQPEAEKPEEAPSQPEAQKPEEVPSQPEAQKPEEAPSQPEVPPQTESSSPEEKAVDANIVLASPIEEVLKQAPASDTPQQQSEEPPQSPVAEEVPQKANSTNDKALNGSPESPTTEEETNSKDKEATTEVPQKPIRRSLVLSSPTSTSPPATLTTHPHPIRGPSPVPTITKSPPAMAPSMNLQEAIRLRTAARSHHGPSRLNLHSPPGFDVRKSPTSTASFIFSKSSKKVVIETRPEVKAEKKTEVPVAKSPEHVTKKELKVPPPVARKPKPKTKEVDSGDVDKTAGQDTHSDNVRKPNGTAGTVEGH